MPLRLLPVYSPRGTSVRRQQHLIRGSNQKSIRTRLRSRLSVLQYLATRRLIIRDFFLGNRNLSWRGERRTGNRYPCLLRDADR